MPEPGTGLGLLSIGASFPGLQANGHDRVLWVLNGALHGSVQSTLERIHAFNLLLGIAA